MRIELVYPVIVDGILKRSAKPKKICGLTSEPWEIEDVSPDDMVRAADIDGRLPYMSHEGKCYVQCREQWVEGQTVEACEIEADDIRPFANDLLSDLEVLRRTYKRDVFAPWTEPSTNAAHVYRLFRNAGDIARRVDRLFPDSVEANRARVAKFMENFKTSRGCLFVRCHEPILLAVPGEVRLATTALFGADVDERERGRDAGVPGKANDAGLEKPTKWTLYPFVHAFPLDRLDDARAMAAELTKAGAVNTTSWASAPGVTLPAMEVHQPMSTQEDIQDREVVRFLRMHMDFMHFLVHDPDAQKNLARGGWPVAYFGTATGFSAMIRAHEYPDEEGRRDISALRAALEKTTAAGDNVRDWPTSKAETMYRRIGLNSRIMLDRLDAAPIEIADVAPGGFGR